MPVVTGGDIRALDLADKVEGGGNYSAAQVVIAAFLDEGCT
jgi:hypothetical protein